MDNAACTAYIVDTAGQQEYQTLRDAHFNEGKGFLLVFSLSDSSSLEEVKQMRDKIISIKNTKKVPFVICANKCDLPPNQIEVNLDECKSYFEKLKIPVLSTSAKVHSLDCRRKSMSMNHSNNLFVNVEELKN